MECNVQDDLACPATAPLFTLPVELWHGDPVVTDPNDPRYTPLTYPTTIPHTACVEGYEVDPVAANNCDDVDVITEVELKSFTGAYATKRSIVLSWETTSETDNLGFNIYRSKSLDGERIKINPVLIPTQVYPGSLEGAIYGFTDTQVKQGVTYYYWLEDVSIYGNTTLHGPVVMGGANWVKPSETGSSGVLPDGWKTFWKRTFGRR